jgi:cellulose synthase/poly-beta-1,6-N-acetylglucosamine synthase-like glycosyltransferase
MKAVFWGAFGLIAANYFLYPIVVVFLSRLARKTHAPGPYEPTVTQVIAAYNEEKVISGKIENSLALEYPAGKLHVIVVSDGSNDRTPSIVSGYADKGVMSLHELERKGKSAALNRAVQHATGEIVVFSDANNMYDRNALRALVRHFKDSSVGGVSGAKKILPHGGRMSTAGDSLYWKYESAIKKAESILGSITAADGEITAIRRELFEPIEEDIINDDAAITFSVIRNGCRFLYDEEAISREYASVSLKDDYFVKVRMVAGGFQTLGRFHSDLWPPKTAFRIQFLLHKALRWLVPEFAILMFLANVPLVGTPFYAATLALQVLFYSASGFGYILLRRGYTLLMFYVPLYFTVMNAAAFTGLLRFLRRKQGVDWRKAVR